MVEQLRQRVAGVDYDEIERRMVRALEDRLGGGYSTIERATLYAALECYITLWEDELIDPTGGLSLESTRQLAARLLPDEGIPAMERVDATPTATKTTTATETAERTDDFFPAAGDPDEYAERPDPDGSSSSGHDSRHDGDLQPLPPRAKRPAVASRHAAPQLLDVNPGGDQGGEDDPARDGG